MTTTVFKIFAFTMSISLLVISGGCGGKSAKPASSKAVTSLVETRKDLEHAQVQIDKTLAAQDKLF